MIQIITILTLLFLAIGQISHSSDKVVIENKVVVNDSLLSFSITSTTIEDFIRAKNTFIENSNFDSSTIKKVNGKIKLPTYRKWKPYVTFTDTLLNTDETYVREYEYLGKFEEIGFYVVCGSFWEHYECYLIDARTGSQKTIWNAPVISPNDKFIANLSMPYGLEGVPNGIQIWQIIRQKNNQLEPIKIEKYLELDQQIWIPFDFVWETDYSIILKVITIDDYWNEKGQANQNNFYYLRLRM